MTNRSSIFSFRVPYEGCYWLLATGTLVGIGWFKGLNLVLLLGYLMLSIWLLNWALAGRRLGRLVGRRRVEGPVFATVPFGWEVELHEPSPKGQVGVRLEDHGPNHALDWFLLRLDGGQTVRFRQEMTLPNRGLYVWEALRVVNRHPFGLVERSAGVAPPEQTIVLPCLGQLHRGRLRRFLAQTAFATGPPRPSAHRHPTAQSEFHGLRAFRTGDSPRWIHWRTSARRGELMVREFEESLADNLILIFDAWLPQFLRLAAGRQVQEDKDCTVQAERILDEAVRFTATVCWEWCRQKGNRLVLAIAGASPEVLHGVTSTELAVQMLECLALQCRESGTNTEKLMELLTGIDLPIGPVLLVSNHYRGPDGAVALQDALVTRLKRPVRTVVIGSDQSMDFYEPPVDSGAEPESGSANRR